MNIRRISLKKGLRIKPFSLFTFFVIFVFFPPAILERTSSFFDNLQKYVQLLVMAILLIKLISKRQIKFSQSHIRWGIYCIYGLMMTLIKEPESIYNFLMRVGVPVFLAVLLCMYYKNRTGGMQRLLDCMYYYWVILIVLNCVMMLLFPSGIIRSSMRASTERANWLFGSKNNVVLPLIFASTIFLYRYLRERKRSIGKLITFFAMVFFNLMWAGSNRVQAFGGSSAGLLAMLAFLMMYCIGCFPVRKYLLRLSAGWYAFAFLLLSVVVIIGSISGNALIGSIFGAVGKDASASQRTYIWIAAINKVVQSPIFGSGYTKAVLADGYMQTYNLFLDSIYRYGVVGLVLLISAFGSYKVQMDQTYHRNMHPNYAFLVGVVAMLVSSLVNTIRLEHIIVLLEQYSSLQTQNEQEQKEIQI